MDKDLISLLVLSSTEVGTDLPHFSRQQGFSTTIVTELSEAVGLIKKKQTDLIILYPRKSGLEEAVQSIETSFKTAHGRVPVIFCLCTKLPETADRQKLYDKGCAELLVEDATIKEIKTRFHVYGNLKASSQENFVQQEKLQRMQTYLDKFKDELKRVKTDLYEERMSLNSALKQVNQLTAERVRLKNEKKDLLNRISLNTKGFFTILVSLIQTRVEHNRGHGERVAHICEFIGKQLGFNEKKLEDLTKAAMLHEAGLLFTPQDILSKSQELLTEYEKDYFIQYPVKGADFLSHCSEFENSALMIRSMNENADGTGYPDGLKRRYIRLESKILAGADLFDSLKDDQAVNDLEAFMVRLETYSGNRLDPNIVSWLEKYAVLHMGSDAFGVRGVGIHQLEPGMKLGTAIFTHTGTKLFSVNTLLTQDAIDKIKKYNREYPVDETVYIRA